MNGPVPGYRPKSDSPLMSKLRELDMGELSADSTVPEKARTRETTFALAFCPLLLLYVGRGMCGDVDCRNCKLPYVEYEEDDLVWFCSSCVDSSDDIDVLPYHGGGRCSGCGRESCILMLCALD